MLPSNPNPNLNPNGVVEDGNQNPVTPVVTQPAATVAQPTQPQPAQAVHPSNAPDADTKAGASIPAALINNPTVPTQKIADQIDANKTSPAPSHTMLYKAAQELEGGPRYDYHIDENGNTVKTERPVSPAHLGLALALQVLSGGMAGATQPANQPGKSFQAGANVAKTNATAVQNANDKSLADANAAQDQRLKIARANMQNYQLALNVGGQSKEIAQILPDSYKPLTDPILSGEMPLPAGSTMEKNFETDAMASIKNQKTNVTKDLLIPYGDAMPVMENGQQKVVNGIPQWGHMYMTIHNADNWKARLTKDIQNKLHEVGMFQQNGKDAEIGEPDWSVPDLAAKFATYTQIKAGEALLQMHADDAHDVLGREPAKLDDLADAARKDPQMRKAVELFSRAQIGAGSDQIDQILLRMNGVDPNATGTLMKYLNLSPKDLADMENKRLEEKTAAATKQPQPKALTPEEKADKEADVKLKLSQVVKNTAEAKKANADTDKILKDETNNDAVVNAIATGHVTADRLGYILARKPDLIDRVMQSDPSFDSSKAQSYPSTYKDFTSGAASKAINAGGTAFMHLNELRALNTIESRVPGTADYQRYENKVDTVADELAKFYENSTIPGIASYKATLNSTLNRDAAITTQAKSMGDKMDAYENQWKNAAPSKAYEAPLPGISEDAKKARAAMDADYAKRLGNVQLPPDAAKQLKEGVNTTFGNGQVWTLKNGQQVRVK